jgi:polyhydroxybutyrate depolymerase
MRWRLGLVAAAALVASDAPSATGAGTARDIEHQGARRAVIVVNAEAAATAPKPLLIVLHGRRRLEQPHATSRRLDELAAREGFVAAYPAGLEGRWNYPSQVVQPSMAGSEPADDMGFVLRLIDTLVGERTADPMRIYASGTSNGAFLTYALMCHASERLAAAAALIAGMFEAQMSACRPARAVPLLSIAGTNDMVVPYDGWLYPTGRLASIAETMEHWRRLHGCTGQSATMLPQGEEADTTRIVQLDWTGCARDGAVRLYRVQGGGHTLPSLQPPEPAQGISAERRSTALETSVAVWSFLRQWSLPRDR